MVPIRDRPVLLHAQPRIAPKERIIKSQPPVPSQQTPRTAARSHRTRPVGWRTRKGRSTRARSASSLVGPGEGGAFERLLGGRRLRLEDR